MVVGIDAGPSSTQAVELAFEIASVEGLLWTSYSAGRRSTPTTTGTLRRTPGDPHRAPPRAERVGRGLSEKYPDVHVTHLTPDHSPVQALVEQPNNASLMVFGPGA